MNLAGGAVLPEIGLAAAESGVTVDRAFLAGRKAVIVVHGSKTADAAKAVSKAVRARQPDAGAVAFVSIIDLRPFAGLWKKVAQAQLKASYAKLAERARAAGLKPEDHVVLCPDWDGAVAVRLGVEKPDERPAAVVADAQGKVVGTAEGPGMPEAVVALLDQAG
jgi:hypothetical protein